MESREQQTKLKLPLTPDWWREVDKNKKKSNYAQIEYLESPSPELLSQEEQDGAIQRDSTIDTPGEIDISNIIFPVHSETEKQLYERNCQKLQCSSSRKFGKTLDNISLGQLPSDINMAHYGLTSTGLMATTISISNLSQISLINLKGNKLSEKSLFVLVSVIQKSSVTEVNLSSTEISKFGPRILSPWLSSTMRIKKLYLRDNHFDDNDGMVLFECIASNRSLKYLDVSENMFFIRCGDALKKLLDENDILEELYLGWNHLRMDAVLSITKGLKKNNGLKILVLNWNGVDDDGAKELGLALKDNESLQELALVCNRIKDSGFTALMKGLEKNSALKTIRIGRNNISQTTAERVLLSLKNGDLRQCAVDSLDFTNNIYKARFQSVIESVKETRTEFCCCFGYEDSYGKRKLMSYDPIGEGLEFLKSYLEENKINLVELFEKFDLDGSMSVTYEEFRQGLKDAGIPMNDEQVSRLIDYLDSDRDGEIDFSELVIATEEHTKKEQISETISAEVLD